MAETRAHEQDAVMQAIELTILLCDQHEKNNVPLEYRAVDYADILGQAVAFADAEAEKRAARRAATPTPSEEPTR